MKKNFFNFEEALNCINNDIPVTRIGNDGKERVYYKKEDGLIYCKVGRTEYPLPYNELLNAENWTWYETNNK